MTLRNPNIPYKLLRSIIPELIRSQTEVVAQLLKSPPIGENALLVYFKTFRELGDEINKISLRISQVSATSMECIKEGSSNQPVDPKIELPIVEGYDVNKEINKGT